MQKKNIILALSVLLLVGYWITKKVSVKESKPEKLKITQVENSSYWTCPMHPQIHQDHAGECPICHMRLVKISESTQNQKTLQQNETSQADKSSSALPSTRHPVKASPEQLTLVGAQKVTAEKMNLKVKIPISGRITSAGAVAFQIYENDARYVHSGVSFIGESSSIADESISGVISSVDSIVDPTSRTIRVIGSIKKGPKYIPSETSFSGEIQIDLKDRLTIPESSVIHTGTKDLVYLIGSNSQLTPQAVKLGIKAEGYFEVIGGLKEGDTISSGPNFLIDSEAKIRGAND